MNINKLKYIFKNIALAYNIKGNLVEKISFGSIDDDKSLVHVLTSNSELISSPIFDTWKQTSIPFFFDSQKKNKIFSNHNESIIINYDVLSPIFYFLSGEQEVNAPKDDYGRFQWKDSLQYKYKITTKPVVNYYMDILVFALAKALKINIRKKNKKTQIQLTHDIDEVTSAWKHRIRLAFENKQYFKAVKYFISQPFKPFSPWKNIDKIANIELKLGYSPTFFFLPNKDKVGDIKNADYSINNNYIKKAIKKLNQSNVKIGLHGSYRTHDEINNFLLEKNNLENVTKQPISVNRFHWLQFDMLKTPILLEKTNITHDYTLGFQEHIGFRNSCCTPFYLYNHRTKESTNVIEYPLAVMDCSIAFEKYMNTKTLEAKKQIFELYSQIKPFNGCLVMNWHNTFLTDYNNKEWFKTYKDIIKELSLLNQNQEEYLFHNLL